MRLLLLDRKKLYKAYRLIFSKSIKWPFFFHLRIGSGCPRGGLHSSKDVSPAATRVFCGSWRNSSRNTATISSK
jgi:hypothetical protein